MEEITVAQPIRPIAVESTKTTVDGESVAYDIEWQAERQATRDLIDLGFVIRFRDPTRP